MREMTTHHVPPTSRRPTDYILMKRRRAHMAYHEIFVNAASYEECCKILKRDWWTPPLS